MTFEDAVRIGLGLEMKADGTVQRFVPVGQRMWCSCCGATYAVETWQDEGSCPCCYSSDVYRERPKEQ